MADHTEVTASVSPPAARWRARLSRLLPLVIGAGLLTLILSRIDLAALARVLGQSRWQWYAVSLGLLVVNLGLVSRRWQFDLGLLQLRYPFLEIFLIDHAGALAGAATPGRLGDLARLVYFRQEKPVLVRVGLSIIIERLFDLTVLLGLSLAFLLSFPLPAAWRQVFALLILGLLGGAGMVLALIWRGSDNPWLLAKIQELFPEALRPRLAHGSQEVRQTLQCYLTWRLLWPLTLTLLAWGVGIVSAYCCAKALTLPLTLVQAGACFCLSTLFTLIPISVAGLGTRELAMVYLFRHLGLPAEQALAFSFLILGYLLAHSALGFVALLLKPPPASRNKG